MNNKTPMSSKTVDTKNTQNTVSSVGSDGSAFVFYGDPGRFAQQFPQYTLVSRSAVKKSPVRVNLSSEFIDAPDGPNDMETMLDKKELEQTHLIDKIQKDIMSMDIHNKNEHESLKTLVQMYITLSIDTHHLPIDSTIDIECLDQANTRLLAVLRSSLAALEQETVHSFFASPLKRAYTALAKFLDNSALYPSMRTKTQLSPTELQHTLETMSGLINAFYMTIALNNLNTEENAPFYERLKLGIELELQRIKQDKHKLIQSEHVVLRYLGNVFLIIAAAIAIATLAAAIIAYSGISIPAVWLSYAATVQATTFVTEGLASVTALLASAGVQATAAQAAAGVAVLSASVCTLFGAAIQPATLRQDATRAAASIERALTC